MRIFHFSDLHIQTPLGEHRLKEMMGKRVAGFVTLKFMFREKRFQWAAAKLKATVELWKREKPDFTIFTGDMTALGFHSEFSEARSILEPILSSGRICGVPGNHDIYVPENVRNDSFVSYFPELVRSDLVVPQLADAAWEDNRAGDEDHATTTGKKTAASFPFVRLVGEHLAIIGLNSAFANWNLIASTGRIAPRQLQTLKYLAGHELLKNRRLIIASHFGLWNSKGKQDTKEHCLENAGQFQEVLHGLSAIAPPILLHGHNHRCYWHVDPNGPLVTVNAGSATLNNRESVLMLDVPEDHTAPLLISQGRLQSTGNSSSGPWSWELGALEEVAPQTPSATATLAPLT